MREPSTRSVDENHTTIEIDGANFRVAMGVEQVKHALKGLDVGNCTEFPLAEGGSILVTPSACGWMRLSEAPPVVEQFLDPEALR